jgi:alpha-mannosidase
MIKLIASIYFLLPILLFSQQELGFKAKIQGEEINYYSPLRQFAPTALLTRANGNSSFSFEAETTNATEKFATYDFLIGHSTGTSSGERKFDVTLNGAFLFTFTTQAKQTGNFEKKGIITTVGSYQFKCIEYDLNKDAFGYLKLTLPQQLVKEKAQFEIKGQAQNSRDWLMVFMVKKEFKINIEPTNLITRKEGKRTVNFTAYNPTNKAQKINFTSKYFNFSTDLKPGYNQFGKPLYPEKMLGFDTVKISIKNLIKDSQVVEIKSIGNFEFNIIHHSHNDIGYSHLQSEVAKIQTENIRKAIRWINKSKSNNAKAIWHIESLWAVENFLHEASPEEELQFVSAVKKGNIVLSANYANILSGLSQKEELNWLVEYGKFLEKKYGFTINCAMITDIPGLTYNGFATYEKNSIPYLSLGPNYVETYEDKGDRVGGVIKQSGDQIYYWRDRNNPTNKVLVWTAGKGYSYFHNVQEKEKQVKWEQKISTYINELVDKKYTFDKVQLRYTLHADNGPVDEDLCNFVDAWNKKFSYPTLVINSIPALYKSIEQKYSEGLAVLSGELTPYWEDGAYSTAVEEMQNRQLSLQTIALEKFVRSNALFVYDSVKFYTLHKNILLFHEHTWGSWCSISDPEIAFTTEQWRIKRSFLDSAQDLYDALAKQYNYSYTPISKTQANFKKIDDFKIDPLTGSFRSLLIEGKEILNPTSKSMLFDFIYSEGINPSQNKAPNNVKVVNEQSNDSIKSTAITFELPTLSDVLITYTLNKRTNKLKAAIHFNKSATYTKESLHIALPFNLPKAIMGYGDADNLLQYTVEQLPGSNKDFICVSEQVVIQNSAIRVNISAPKLALFEVGSITNENLVNSQKVWKKTNKNFTNLFLYVFNNYWHTNYKASQSGIFDFEVELSFE